MSLKTKCLPGSLVLIIGLCLLCSCDTSKDGETFVVEGTVRLSEVGPGCWFILATDGARYEPVNLAEDLKEEGLHVSLLVRPRDDMVSACMVGRIVEVVSVFEPV
jgi:hypothetical protein